MKPEFKYKTYVHAKTHIRYHLIFSTKFRRRCLDGIRDDVLAAFRQAESVSHFRIHRMEPDGDHIHFLIEVPPRYSIEQTVRRMKMVSTKFLYERQEGYLRRWYWKKKRILWTHGYFCATIGAVCEDVVDEYIKNQWVIHIRG